MWQVSVFVLDIDEASKGLSSKAEKEQLLDIFRRDMRALKEMSHPNVLKIHEVYSHILVRDPKMYCKRWSW
jgi:hypothetical protein